MDANRIRIFYAPEGTPGGEGKPGEGKPGEGKPGEGKPDTKTAEEKAAEEKAAAEKKAQEEADAKFAAARKSGAESLWKKHGFDSEKAFNEYMAAKKAEDDAKKSEAEKANGKAAEAEKKAQEARAEADRALAENAAMKAGVDPAKADKFVRIAMAYEGDTPAAKVEAALKDFPEFKVGAEGAGGAGGKGGFGDKSKNQGGDARSQAEAQARAAMGLKPKTTA